MGLVSTKRRGFYNFLYIGIWSHSLNIPFPRANSMVWSTRIVINYSELEISFDFQKGRFVSVFCQA